jgi:hypothetical protein
MVLTANQPLSNQEPWHSYIEVLDWKRKKWRFNYSKYVTSSGWCIDWEVLTPNGSIKASKEKDAKLAQRCLNQSGLVDKMLLEYEVSWFINHYTNTINLKALKALQEA